MAMFYVTKKSLIYTVSQPSEKQITYVADIRQNYNYDISHYYLNLHLSH